MKVTIRLLELIPYSNSKVKVTVRAILDHGQTYDFVKYVDAQGPLQTSDIPKVVASAQELLVEDIKAIFNEIATNPIQVLP